MIIHYEAIMNPKGNMLDFMLNDDAIQLHSKKVKSADPTCLLKSNRKHQSASLSLRRPFLALILLLSLKPRLVFDFLF